MNFTDRQLSNYMQLVYYDYIRYIGTISFTITDVINLDGTYVMGVISDIVDNFTAKGAF